MEEVRKAQAAFRRKSVVKKPAAKSAAKKPAAKPAAKISISVTAVWVRSPTTPAEIIEALAEIGRLPWTEQDAAKAARPEWFEFCTRYGREDREVRKKALALLYGIPGMTKTKLCDAAGCHGAIGHLNKFLENKSSNSAGQCLSHLIDVIEQVSEPSAVKRRRRLQCALKHGMGLSNMGEEGKWRAEKLARFRKGFPGVELEFGDKSWQVCK